MQRFAASVKFLEIQWNWACLHTLSKGKEKSRYLFTLYHKERDTMCSKHLLILEVTRITRKHAVPIHLADLPKKLHTSKRSQSNTGENMLSLPSTLPIFSNNNLLWEIALDLIYLPLMKNERLTLGHQVTWCHCWYHKPRVTRLPWSQSYAYPVTFHYSGGSKICESRHGRPWKHMTKILALFVLYFD